MNIAIIGYGKMGKTIEKIAEDRGHQIVLKISSSNITAFTKENLVKHKVDVAIEFTQPEAALKNITTCFESGVNVVSGTTAWLNDWDKAIEKMKATECGFIYASNFSVGVNLFFALNKRLAELMNPHTEYGVKIKEIHHTAKLDAPSGTAITLAEGILENVDRKSEWSKIDGNDEKLFVESVREDPAPGTHEIIYESEIDSIEIIHTAKSRQGFAMGAVLAAEYIFEKQGLYTMKDVLGI